MTRPVKNLSGFVATGDASHFGTNDVDQLNNYLTGQDQVATTNDPVTIGTATTFNSGKLIAPNIVNTGTLTLPTATDTLIGRNTTDVLTNKTLTTPVIKDGSNNTLTLPTGVDTVVARTSTDTLTNKTLTSPTITTPTLSSYIDYTRISAPANPAANMGRAYVKQIDANNDGIFILVKKNGAFVEVQIA